MAADRGRAGVRAVDRRRRRRVLCRGPAASGRRAGARPAVRAGRAARHAPLARPRARRGLVGRHRPRAGLRPTSRCSSRGVGSPTSRSRARSRRRSPAAPPSPAGTCRTRSTTRTGSARSAARLVAGYLRDLGTELAALSPGAGIAVSGFAQGWATPEQVVELWTAIVARAPLTLLLFQDGIGAGKLTLDEESDLPAAAARVRWIGAASSSASSSSCSPLRAPAAGVAAGFAAVPAPLARIARQLALAERFASGPVVAFSVAGLHERVRRCARGGPVRGLSPVGRALPSRLAGTLKRRDRAADAADELLGARHADGPGGWSTWRAPARGRLACGRGARPGRPPFWPEVL